MSSFAANILYKTALCSRMTQTKETAAGCAASLDFFSFKAVSSMLTYSSTAFFFRPSLISILLAHSCLYLLTTNRLHPIVRSNSNCFYTRSPKEVITLRYWEMITVTKAPLLPQSPNSSPGNHTPLSSQILNKGSSWRKNNTKSGIWLSRPSFPSPSLECHLLSV